MEELTRPLIVETTDANVPEVSVITLDENDTTRKNERDSSFIEIKDTARRTTSLPITKADMHAGICRNSSVPVSNSRDNLRVSRKQSVVVSGDDRFILEESTGSTDEADDDKVQTDGRRNSDASAKSFVNIHVSFKLLEFAECNLTHKHTHNVLYCFDSWNFIILLVHQR